MTQVKNDSTIDHDPETEANPPRPTQTKERNPARTTPPRAKPTYHAPGDNFPKFTEPPFTTFTRLFRPNDLCMYVPKFLGMDD